VGKRDFIEQRDAPTQCYRWLVELDCGCVTDALTAGHFAAHVPIDQLRPVDCVFERMLGDDKSGACRENVLLFGWGVRWKHSNRREGWAWCADHDDAPPIREIVEWVERKQCPGYYSDRLQKDMGPYGSWLVKLSCGHYVQPVVTEVEWRPEQGHRELPDFVAEIRQRLESGDLRDKTRKLLDWSLALYGTEPKVREECPDCAYVRRIVGCRPIGPLARPKLPPKPKEPEKPPSRRTLTRRLNAAEADVSRLREQLGQAEQEAAHLRQQRDQAH
jgi:hypothetical protein